MEPSDTLSALASSESRGMNRIDKIAQDKKSILARYLQPGNPSMPVDQVEIYLEAGVDIIEIGFPCDDSYLDGLIVADAMRRALMAGMTSHGVRNELKHIREFCPDPGIVLPG